MYDCVMLNSILAEINQTAYCYGEEDRVLLQEMLECINQKFGTDYHYLAEIASILIPGASEIVLCYFDRFQSESVRGYLTGQLAFDKPPDCDIILYKGYLRFKNSDMYISRNWKPSPAHIHSRYDNALRRLRPRRLRKELSELAECPRDVVYLPFTTRMAASWKLPSFEKLIRRYFSAMTIPAQEFGLSEDMEDSYPQLPFMREQLLFSAISWATYYPTEENESSLRALLTDKDPNVQAAAQKALNNLLVRRGIEDKKHNIDFT